MGTMGLDGKGRDIIVGKTVSGNKYVLDVGGGTGTTAIKAAQKLDSNGKVVLLDLSEGMLERGRKIIEELNLQDKIELHKGDMYEIPFPDNTFDVVLSSYSTCPLEDPLLAVREMLRVMKKDGLLGIAHSVDSDNALARWISSQVEKVIWRFPRLSLGCRNINLIDGIKEMNVEIIENSIIGHIPFFFKILIVKKL